MHTNAKRFLNALTISRNDPDLRQELASLYHYRLASFPVAEFYFFDDNSILFVPPNSEPTPLSDKDELIDFIAYWEAQIQPGFLRQLINYLQTASK